MASREIYASGFDEDEPIQQTSCPECSGRIERTNREAVCRECGLVVSDQRVDRGPEWRPHNADEQKRTGGGRTVTRHDRGLSTKIGRGEDGNGKTLWGRTKRLFRRLRRHHTRSKFQGTRERNEMRGHVEVKRLAGALDLPQSVREQASVLFRTAQDEDLLRGRSVEGIAAAALYAGCRCNDLPRTVAEVASPTRVPDERVRHYYSVLNTELGLPVAATRPSEYVQRFASALDVPGSVRRRALELASIATEIGVSNGRLPRGVAAGCLMVASADRSQRFTQSRLADVADVSPRTVRERTREM
jgi:transcription initiation factor TFIIB